MNIETTEKAREKSLTNLALTRPQLETNQQQAMESHNMSINLEEMTVSQARQIAALFNAGQINVANAPVSHPYEIGKAYLIRTVSMIDTGRIVEVTAQEIVLEDAAWVADTGRFSDALKSCNFNEVEPFPDGRVIINRSSVIDACKIEKVQRSQK